MRSLSLLASTERADSVIGFRALTYQGSSSTIPYVRGCGFKPDLVWVKSRDFAGNHYIYDSLRGPRYHLSSDEDIKSTYDEDGLARFETDGFLPGETIGATYRDYSAWCWKADQDGVFINDVQLEKYSKESGLSIIKYTGDGVPGRTLEHSLSISPNFIIVKAISTTGNWITYNDYEGATRYTYLNSAGTATIDSTMWNDTEPTPLTVTLGDNDYVNKEDVEYIAYIFSEVEGVSKSGIYIGDTTDPGPAITCGFEPAYVLIKCSTAVGSWRVFDNARRIDLATSTITHQPINPKNKNLMLNSDDVEESGYSYNIDFNADGFQIMTSSGSYINTDGGVFKYIAFAEVPDEILDEPQGFRAKEWDGLTIYYDRKINDIGFRPDLVFIYNTTLVSVSSPHCAFSSLRGPDLALELTENDVELSTVHTLQSFNPDGFSIGSSQIVNYTGESFISYSWNAGNQEHWDDTGTIPVLRKTNADRGFTTLQYTGTGASGTISHGLGEVPTFVMFKSISSTQSWLVYHKSAGETMIQLFNLYTDFITYPMFDDIAPTSSVMSISNRDEINALDVIYEAHFWTDVDGYCKTGIYSGGNISSTVIDCGFDPDLVMIKQFDNGGIDGYWMFYDSVRGSDKRKWNTDLVEDDTDPLIFRSTGFSFETINNTNNEALQEYVFVAFKSDPLPTASPTPVFNAIAYPGGSADHVEEYTNITGFGFDPDLVWFRNRDSSLASYRSHLLFDTMRGPNETLEMTDDNQYNAADLGNGIVNGFIADGVIGSGSYLNYFNTNIVAWGWNAGDERVKDTVGFSTNNAEIRANPSGGFSIVKYEGNSLASYIGHGLGAVPKMIWVKNLTSDATDWNVYSSELGADYKLELNTDAASSSGHWNWEPTDTVINFTDSYHVNNTGNDYIAYVWAESEGQSSFGSYTGNGLLYDQEIELGFEPAFVMIKRTDSTGNWCMFDTKRDVYDNENNYYLSKALFANNTDVETTSLDDYNVRITETGFEISTVIDDLNAAGGNYIYAAFGIIENPNIDHTVETGDYLLPMEDQISTSDPNYLDAQGHEFSFEGSDVYLTDTRKCGQKSMWFDGPTDLTSDSYDDMKAHYNDWTLDFWMKFPETLVEDQDIISFKRNPTSDIMYQTHGLGTPSPYGVSFDKGQTWTTYSGTTSVGTYDMVWINDSLYSPGSSGQISRSDDYGATWTQVNGTGYVFLAGFFIPETNAMIFTRFGNLTYCTIPYDTSWTTISTTGMFTQIFYTGDIYVGMTNTGGIYTSTNLSTWTSRDSTMFSFLGYDPVSGTFLATNSNTIKRSYDGLIWSSITSFLSVGSITYIAWTGNVWVALGVDTGNYTIWTTSNIDGTGFVLQSTEDASLTFWIDGADICYLKYAGTGSIYEVYRSTDDGVTFIADGVNWPTSTPDNPANTWSSHLFGAKRYLLDPLKIVNTSTNKMTIDDLNYGQIDFGDESIPETYDWNHYAFGRYDDDYVLWKNGVVTKTKPYGGKTDMNHDYFTIGSENFKGYIDHLRYTIGNPLWDTTNFEMTDKGLHYEPGTLDDDEIEYGSLLVKGDSTIEDYNGNHTITTSGTVAIDTNDYKCGTGSMSFAGGVDDYISMPDSSDFYIGSGAFTIDFWVKRGAIDVTEQIFGQGNNTGLSTEVNIGGGFSAGNAFVFTFRDTSGTTQMISETLIEDEFWHHIGIVKSHRHDEITPPTINIFIDGQVEGFVAEAAEYDFMDVSYDFRIGSYGEYVGENFIGNIDQFRFMRNQLWKYKSYFDLNDEDLYYDAGTIQYENNGVLLIKGDDSLIEDYNATHTVTNEGTVTTSAVDYMCGNGSMIFDGTNDLVMADSSDWTFGNCTIDFWMKRGTLGVTSGLFNHVDDTTGTWDIQCSIDATGMITAELVGERTYTLTSTVLITDTSWHHIAIERIDGSFVLFIDGIVDAYDYRIESYPATEHTFEFDMIFLSHSPEDGTEVIQDQALTTTYVKDTDYSVMWNTITRIPAGAIASDATVSISYDYESYESEIMTPTTGHDFVVGRVGSSVTSYDYFDGKIDHFRISRQSLFYGDFDTSSDDEMYYAPDTLI